VTRKPPKRKKEKKKGFSHFCFLKKSQPAKFSQEKEKEKEP